MEGETVWKNRSSASIRSANLGNLSQRLSLVHQKLNRPDSALHGNSNRRGTLSVSIVRIFVVLFFEIRSGDTANAARSMSHYPHVTRQPHRRLAHAALNVGIDGLFAVDGEIDEHSACSHVQRQPRDRDIAKMQSPLACAHLYF